MNAESKETSVSAREATPAELEHWDDRVRQCEGHRVVHLRAWLASLQESGFGRPLFLVCERDGETVAYWPGMLTKRGPLKMFGSPPPGSQTVSMGPVLAPGKASSREVVAAGVEFLERRLGVHHIEFLSNLLDEQGAKDLGFSGETVGTCCLALSPGAEDDVLKGFTQNARRNIRRAGKLQLEARFERDESFVDEAYEQIQEVFIKGGNLPSFGKLRAVAFFRQMKASGNLLAVSVYLPDGGPNIATGMFTVEGRELTLWQWAHRTEYRWYRPTEFMTWTVMQKAMEMGCDRFDMMGQGSFKKNFGATLDDSKHRWMKSRYRWIQLARHWANKCYRRQQSWRGRLARIYRKPAPLDKEIAKPGGNQ